MVARADAPTSHDPNPSGEAARGGSPGVRPDVQGLRALAVAAVVLDHAGVANMSGGYVGVDVFFVLSGFLITGLLVREVERNGRVGLGAFYARRARRILPAATVVLVAVVAFAGLELSYRAVQLVTVDAGWAATFLANVHFSAIGTDYFAQGQPPSPLQHYWSLSVEEQFYLVWPPLLALLIWIGRRGARAPWRLVVTIAGALCVASFTWSLLVTRTDATAAYFSSAARAWELGAGMLLALVGPRLPSLRRPVREGLALAGLVAIVVSTVGFQESTPMPGYHALLPVLGTVALLAAGPAPTAVGRLLSLRPLTSLGDLSYSVYLWHWPVLVLWAARTGEERSALETTALIGVVLVLSVASYHLVENPVRRGRWWRRSPARGLVLWPVALAVVALAVLGGRELAGHRLQQRIEQSQQYASLRTAHLSVRQELSESLRMADAGEPIAFPLRDLSEVDGLSKDLWNYEYGCWVGHDRSRARLCPVGDTGAERTMVVLGDSHAGQWLPALDALGLERGYRVVPLIKYGCVPYDVPQLTDDLTRPYTECDGFRAWVLEELPRLRPDVVVIGSRSMPPNMQAPPAQRPEVWLQGVRGFLDAVRTTTSDVWVLGDTSPLDFDPIDCLTDRRATMSTCTGVVTTLVREANEITAQAAEQSGATYLGVLPMVCLDGRCPAFAGGRMVYANSTHLSVDWVRHVLPAFRAALDRPRGQQD